MAGRLLREESNGLASGTRPGGSGLCTSKKFVSFKWRPEEISRRAKDGCSLQPETFVNLELQTSMPQNMLNVHTRFHMPAELSVGFRH